MSTASGKGFEAQAIENVYTYIRSFLYIKLA